MTTLIWAENDGANMFQIFVGCRFVICGLILFFPLGSCLLKSIMIHLWFACFEMMQNQIERTWTIKQLFG